MNNLPNDWKSCYRCFQIIAGAKNMIQVSLDNYSDVSRKIIDWSIDWESYALEHGQELTVEQLADAAQVGIQQPEKIRLVTLPNLPSPFDHLRANRDYYSNPLACFPHKWSCALGYGILNKQVEWDNRDYTLISLAHSALCEQLGGIELYLRQYVRELLTFGFYDSPLEHRAHASASRARNLRTLIKPSSNIEIGGAEFEKIVKLLSQWIENWEAFALKHGIELSDSQRMDAESVGIKNPQRVRLLEVPTIPLPTQSILYAALVETGLFGPSYWAYCMRYGILARPLYANDRRVIAHELAHTAQFERMGSVEAAVRQSLTEVLMVGYHESPLEHEAHELADRCINRS